MTSRKQSTSRTANRSRASSIPKAKQTSAAAEKFELRLDQLLGRFADALAIVETAYSALDKSEADKTATAAKVLTLRTGIDALKAAYSELDLTIIRLRIRGADA